ncbi:MAG: hypothetical protein MH321_04320 [Leptospiraceae bacterium]|nr:hypothetical protein [Leptospiraceae bacterium]
MNKYIYIIIPFLLFVNCKNERGKIDLDFSPEMKAKLEASKQLIQSNEKESYYISNGSKTPEEAVKKFLLIAITQSDLSKNPFIFTEKENLEVQYPNIYGSGTSLDITPLDDYKNLVEKRAQIGYEKINTKMKLFTDKATFEIHFQNPREYKKLQGIKPRVTVKLKGKTIYIDEIKMVFKVGDSFKVGVISP